MEKSYLRGGSLLGLRARSTDGALAGILDLVADLGDAAGGQSWVPYLAVEADAWAPDKNVLVATRRVAGIDAHRAEVEVDLSADQLRHGPVLAADGTYVRDYSERYERLAGWEGAWNAETDADPDLKSTPMPPIPPAPAAEEPQPGESNADNPGLVRLQSLRRFRGRTADDRPVRLADLLIDETDWRVAYLEVMLEDESDLGPCPIPGDAFESADRVAERFDLRLAADAVRAAGRRAEQARHADAATVRIDEDSGGSET